MNIQHRDLGFLIIKKLIDSSGRLGYNGLYREIKKERFLARSTFSLYFRDLVEQHFVSAFERKRGKLVKYYVTQRALEFIKLELVIPSIEKSSWEEIRKKTDYNWDLYHLLFYLSARHPEYRLKTDYDLKKFLAKIKLNMGVLQTDAKFRSDRRPYCLAHRFYYDLMITRYKEIPLKSLEGNRKILTRREDHLYFDLTNKSKNFFTLEQQKEAEVIENRRLGTKGHVYYVVLPGFAVSDFFRTRRINFHHIGKREDDVKKAFDRLEGIGLVKPIGHLGPDLRYCIADERLEKLLWEYWRLWNFITGMMRRIWENFRSPTEEELKWFSRFYGERVVNELYRIYYECRERLANYETVRKCQLLKDEGNRVLKFHAMIPREFEKLRREFLDVFLRYSDFPLNSLREMLYPSFLELNELTDIRKIISLARKDFQK